MHAGRRGARRHLSSFTLSSYYLIPSSLRHRQSCEEGCRVQLEPLKCAYRRLTAMRFRMLRLRALSLLVPHAWVPS